MKFKDFQAPVLFSSTFKALNLGEKIQVLSRMRTWESCLIRRLRRPSVVRYTDTRLHTSGRLRRPTGLKPGPRGATTVGTGGDWCPNF